MFFFDFIVSVLHPPLLYRIMFYIYPYPCPLLRTQWLEILSIADDSNSRHARDSQVWYLYDTISALHCTGDAVEVRSRF